MELKEHIDDIRDRLKNEEYPNERAVRQCIIDRLLCRLGWPVYAPQIVYPEYTIAEIGTVDYVLYHPKSKNPRVLIEAKQVNSITAGAEQQLFDYISHISVPIAILTDGRQWIFFHPIGKGHWKEHKLRLDLSTEDSRKSAERLERYLGYEAICTGEVDKMIKQDYDNLVIKKEIESHLPNAWENVIEKDDELLTKLIAKEIMELCGHHPTNEQVLDYLKSLKKIVPPVGSSGGSPIRKKGYSMRVIMDDGTEIC
ncbi:MAG: type I restriction enzyme HsdR N-terminal domain-containing protein, partial [Proteobacteria bacterium]|nr:type I restriction enzyme HsdR N-terminal domain-containing protein [Pseudomonadota bacterium]